MPLQESLGHGHFAQLYFHAAKVRAKELEGFLERAPDGEEQALSRAELLAAADAAEEVHQYLLLVQTYLEEARHLGQSVQVR